MNGTDSRQTEWIAKHSTFSRLMLSIPPWNDESALLPQVS